MKGILIYQAPDKTAPVPDFIDGLDPRLREKIIIRLYHLSQSHKPELKEPHFKRISSLERYRDLCELRVKSKMLIRITSIFAPMGMPLCLSACIRSKLKRLDGMILRDAESKPRKQGPECEKQHCLHHGGTVQLHCRE